MTITPPTVAPVTVDFPSVVFRGQQDVQPFTYRSGMTYTQLLESIRVWLYNTLVPYLNTNFEDFASSWETNVQQIAADVQTAINNEDTAVNTAIANATNAWATANLSVTDPAFLALINSSTSQSRQAMDLLYGSTGVWHVPVPTGVAATDTSNFLSAISTAQQNNYDLEFSVSPLGTIREYALNQAIAWDLSRGSIRGKGHVGLNFSYMPSNATGAAFTLKGPGATANYNHMGAIHRASGFYMKGEDTDTSTLDGFLVSDTGAGIDQSLIESVHVYGFRDNITFGSNVWSTTFSKVASANAHRYGLNLTDGINAGECITLRDCTIYNCHNAAGNAAAIYSPNASGVDFRMFGGSLDYNDYEGVIQGGNLTFSVVHIEDRSPNPMFTYSMTSGQNPTIVSFRDCTWDSSNTGIRDHLHEILASTGNDITITFDGDKGGLAGAGGTINTWLVNNSGIVNLIPAVTFANWGVSRPNSAGISLGDFVNLLSNGSFDDTQTFVATPGVRGWYASGSATFNYAGTSTGQGIRCATSSALTGNVQQRIPIGSARRPLRIGTTISSTAWTAGTAGVYYQFYAEDGTTAVGAQYRVGTDVNSNLSGVYKRYSERVVPPKGAAYLMVLLNVNGWNGTAFWDNIEVVPV